MWYIIAIIKKALGGEMKYSKELHDYIQLFVKMNEEFPDDSLATVEETQALLDEIDRLNVELSELNDKAVFIKFENEDELPAEIKDDVYSAMFECSHVDGVRLFPYIEENGQKYFLVMLKEVV